MKKPITIETTFSEYTLTEVIGEGGAGRVYGGTDPEGMPIAVKVLALDRTSSDKRRRFKNEIAFLRRNKHPNIVSLLDHGLATDKSLQGPFYVMPRYGSNLRQKMKKGLTADDALRLFSQILDGVEAAHLQGAVHRDLKPENVLIDTKTGTPAVADFGVASFTDDIVATLVETMPSQRLANFTYAAPEQRSPGQKVSFTADIYALGLLLNEMLTGEVPHGTDYTTVSAVHKDLGYLDAVIAQMIRQAPTNRFDSIAHVKSAIAVHRGEFLSRQKISQIDETVIPEGQVDDPLALEPPKLVGADWDKGVLTLVLDRPVNRNWESALHNMGSYTGVYGIPPTAFTFTGNQVRVAVQSHDVQSVVNHFKSWLPIATRVLKGRLEQNLAEKRAMEEKQLRQQRAAEAERLKVLNSLKI